MRERLLSSGLIALCVLNSQVITATAHNPVGIRYARELYLAVLIGYAAWRTLYFFSRHALPKFFVWVLALSVLPALWSAITALVVHGQPLRYGLLEERRLFEFLSGFVIADLATRAGVPGERLVKLVFGTAVFCAALGIGFQLGLVPDLRSVLGDFDGRPGVRELRASIGLPYLVLSLYIALLSAVRFRAADAGVSIRHPVAWSFFFLAVIAFIGQTRQIFIVGASVAGLYLIKEWRRAIQYLPHAAFVALVTSAVVSLSIPASRLLQYWNLLTALSDREYITASARAKTIAVIVREVGTDLFFGGGALSLKWQDGFSRVYGSFFYLADVGDVGVVYRYGIFAVLYFAATLLFLWRCHARVPPGFVKTLCGVGFLFSLVTSFTAGFQMYQGTLLGLLVALCEIERQRALAPEHRGDAPCRS